MTSQAHEVKTNSGLAAWTDKLAELPAKILQYKCECSRHYYTVFHASGKVADKRG